MGTIESPALGALAARAHDYLLECGHPLAADDLVERVFGRVAGRPGKSRTGVTDFWHGQLARLLTDGSVFTQLQDGSWGLTEWGDADIPLDEMEYVVIDCETTGLDPQNQRVIEVAALVCRGPTVVERFSTLIDPERSLPHLIRQLTGITPDLLVGAPKAPVVIAEFLSLVGNRILVGHNVRFDINFLSAEAQRHLHVKMVNPGLCTIRLSQQLLPHLKRPNLDNLAGAVGLETKGRHRALADADLTQRAFWLLVERARERGIATQGRLLALGGLGRSGGRSQVARAESGALLDPLLRKGVPDKPGVYLMRDARGEVIYVGKAKNLKKRIGSYYSQTKSYLRRKEGLLEAVRELETRVVGSELEALIVESRLIKEFLPRYNVQQRYYDGYCFIKVDVVDPFPRVIATREVHSDGARYFGPFRSKRVVDTVVDLVQRLYPVRTCTRKLAPDGSHRKSKRAAGPCFRFLIGRCLAPCMGETTPQVYAETVKEVLAFLGGGNSGMLKRVEQEMFSAARTHDFERASRMRDALHQAERLLLSQQLLSGAIERNNLVIVCRSIHEGQVELFGIRHGRLFDQQALSPDQQAGPLVRQFLSGLSVAAAAPPIVGKEEIDAIIIISRWVARFAHSRQIVALPEEPDDHTVLALIAAGRHVLASTEAELDGSEWEETEANLNRASDSGYAIGMQTRPSAWSEEAEAEWAVQPEP